jgi:hypothetical protein
LLFVIRKAALGRGGWKSAGDFSPLLPESLLPLRKPIPLLSCVVLVYRYGSVDEPLFFRWVWLPDHRPSHPAWSKRMERWHFFFPVCAFHKKERLFLFTAQPRFFSAGSGCPITGRHPQL